MSRGRNNKDSYDISYPRIFNEIINYKSLPICAALTHSGFWTTDREGNHIASSDKNCNRNSVMLSPGCLFYVYKIAFRHLLLSMKIIEPSDIDPANLVPHIVIRKNKDDPFGNMKYDQIQNEKFLISETDLSVKSDFIIMELDKKRDLHMTLIYSKGIKRKIDLVEAFGNVIKLLNRNHNLIYLYSGLNNFGAAEIDYWYETGNLYPNNVIIPDDYVKVVKETPVITVTAAGSVI